MYHHASQPQRRLQKGVFDAFDAIPTRFTTATETGELRPRPIRTGECDLQETSEQPCAPIFFCQRQQSLPNIKPVRTQ